jgi:hypothetical protein
LKFARILDCGWDSKVWSVTWVVMIHAGLCGASLC